MWSYFTKKEEKHEEKHEEVRNINAEIEQACCVKWGNLRRIDTLIKEGVFDYNLGLFYACREGSYGLVIFMVFNGTPTNWNEAMNETMNTQITHSREAIIELLLLNRKYANYLEIFRNCCSLGYIKVIKYMIKKYRKISLYSGFYNACRGGHLDLVKLLIEHGANNWNGGLEGACYGGHYKIVIFMIYL